MTAFVSLAAIAGFIFALWWMLSVRSSLKAIQRHLGADPQYSQVQQAKAQRAAQHAMQRHPGKGV